ncbi:hypothetical protein CEW87_08810 [Parazoarcus communis]|uniref:Uncharacterized protein n=1 Tax=Parazoarcus communis TaxID=41977 RepID=A0A2U8H1F9_9RHOO|nr:hypothetical protein CEW87_08810 [Parazoarcus communis]
MVTSVAQGRSELSEEDQNAVVGTLSLHANEIAKNQPEKLAKLRNDIELVTLETLIKRHEEMHAERLIESLWHDFLNEGPFILSMAFGYSSLSCPAWCLLLQFQFEMTASCVP